MEYEPYREYNCFVGGLTSGAACGVMMAARFDVEYTTGSGTATFYGLQNSVPYLENNHLGTKICNTNRPFKMTARFPDSFPVVTATSSGAITAVGPGNWVDCSLYATAQGGGFYYSALTDTGAVSVTYGHMQPWYEVEFAVRI